MPTISKPRYQKTGPSYLFDVHYDTAEEDDVLSIFLEADEVLTVERLQEALSTEWWPRFVEVFRVATATYFTRPVSSDRLRTLFHHRLPDEQGSHSSNFPRILLCLPRRIEHTQGQLWCHWGVDSAPASLEIPAEAQEVQLSATAATAPAVSGSTVIEEWDVDAFPVSEEATVLEDPQLLLERQRVKEARLKAKVAIYRAQMEMNRFYEKYGGDVSDSDMSDASDASASASESEED
jgi:hypothetical protein